MDEPGRARRCFRAQEYTQFLQINRLGDVKEIQCAEMAARNHFAGVLPRSFDSAEGVKGILHYLVCAEIFGEYLLAAGNLCADDWSYFLPPAGAGFTSAATFCRSVTEEESS